MLIVTHEGTEEVKERKVDKLVSRYETFTMYENETITDMFTRFTNIVNSLKVLGRTYTNAEKVRKILRSLPNNWRPKKIAIEEAKDLTKISLDYLLGSLQTHEVELQANKETSEIKTKSIALKSSQNTEEVSDDDDEDFNLEKEISLITRKFKKFLKKKGNFLTRTSPMVTSPMEKKKKAYAATWDSSDEEEKSDSEDEVTNLALMALGNEEQEVNQPIETEPLESYTRGELQEAFEELYEESLKLENDKPNLEKDTLNKRVDALTTKEYSWDILSTVEHIVFNKRSLMVEKSMNVRFDESLPTLLHDSANDDDHVVLDELKNKVDNVSLDESKEKETTIEKVETLPRDIIPHRVHPLDAIIGDLDQGIQTRSTSREICNHTTFISKIEPKNIEEALRDSDWIGAMQEELHQFKQSKVWELVPKLDHQTIIGAKWVFRNKLDEDGNIVRNKARLVAKGYNQQEDDIIFGSTNKRMCIDSVAR
ncbi:uncharacterized protein LOC122064568 [Macadamia integrifolia]|uniref:uncharacterized protein LOC122064568 n=1 Tax=Macadamia integrifolia TaxID=60698 RepID=UPI001C500E84|nr:uncharacterized protein LOC122064568 [Macadamia integrifolia]